MKLTILSISFTQDSEFPLFFGKTEETIICLRDCLTFDTYLCNVENVTTALLCA